MKEEKNLNLSKKKTKRKEKKTHRKGNPFLLFALFAYNRSEAKDKLSLSFSLSLSLLPLRISNLRCEPPRLSLHAPASPRRPLRPGRARGLPDEPALHERRRRRRRRSRDRHRPSRSNLSSSSLRLPPLRRLRRPPPPRQSPSACSRWARPRCWAPRGRRTRTGSR